jgi:hypothetical protein
MSFLLLFLPGRAHGDDLYFLIMFGAQRDAIQLRYTHTFATFIRARGCGTSYQLEVHTISWLPATLDVRPFALRPECGRNLGLHETIRWCLSNDERVSMWGPYRITADLYARAVQQCQLLDSGQVRYKADDSFHKSSRVSNCIHAVSSIDTGYRLRVVSPEWGETASWYVLRRMEPCILDVCYVYPTIATSLGLDAYPLVHRPFHNPRSGPGWRTLKVFAAAR